MRVLSFGLGLVSLVLMGFAGSHALATTYYDETITCPVGGEKFTHPSIGSYSTWGQRPDGKPYGSGPFPFPLMECPANHLVVYRNFSDDEHELLKRLIVSETYLGMVSTESQYYRAAWLEKQLVPNSKIYLSLLLRATWQTDEEPTKKAMYQDFLLHEIDAAALSVDTNAGLYFQYIKLNTLRERGRFAEAKDVYDALPMERLGVNLPPASLSYEAFELYSAEHELGDDAIERWYILAELNRILSALNRQDYSSEPIDLIGTRAAAFKCKYEAETLTEFEKNYCLRPEITEITMKL